MQERYFPAAFLGNGITGGSYTGAPFRVVLHTTETAGLPSYQGGKSAPHLTYDPKSRKWVQHTSLGHAARSLARPGDVQTNRNRALQVEIICYSNKAIADESPSRIWAGDLPATAYTDLAAFVAWCALNFGVALRWPERQALSAGATQRNGFRMAPGEWNDFDGVCSHQHVPHNTHWDTGALDMERLLAQARRLEPVDDEARRREHRHDGDAYVVERGDTLTRIARELGVTLASLRAANPEIGDGDVIFPGQVLRVPNGRPAAATTHVVRRGEKLGAIAARFGVSVPAVLAANPEIEDPDLIFPGQVITIPSTATRSLSA